MRAVLYMAAPVVSNRIARWSLPIVRHSRKTAKARIIATMRKLLAILNAIAKQPGRNNIMLDLEGVCYLPLVALISK